MTSEIAFDCDEAWRSWRERQLFELLEQQRRRNRRHGGGSTGGSSGGRGGGGATGVGGGGGTSGSGRERRRVSGDDGCPDRRRRADSEQRRGVGSPAGAKQVDQHRGAGVRRHDDHGPHGRHQSTAAGARCTAPDRRGQRRTAKLDGDDHPDDQHAVRRVRRDVRQDLRHVAGDRSPGGADAVRSEADPRRPERGAQERASDGTDGRHDPPDDGADARLDGLARWGHLVGRRWGGGCRGGGQGTGGAAGAGGQAHDAATD